MKLGLQVYWRYFQVYMQIMPPGSYFWAVFYPERAEICKNSGFFGHFLKKFLLCDHEIWFTYILEVLSGVCKSWSPGPYFWERLKVLSRIRHVSANAGLIFALVIYRGQIRAISFMCAGLIYFVHLITHLTHCGRDKMAAISKTVLSNAFSRNFTEVCS